MKRTTVIISSLLVLITFATFPICKKVDFDVSMERKKYPILFRTAFNSIQYNFFKNLYNRNFVEAIPKNAQLKIPKIFHYIWLGGKVPDVYTYARESWLKKHPEWIFIFWTDSIKNMEFGDYVVTSFEEVEQILANRPLPGTRIVVGVSDLKYENKTFFDRSPTYSERSNILMWEVVYRFGGVHIDVHQECLRPLDELHYQYDFYTALQPLDTEKIQLGAALFAACRQHPLLKACVNGIKKNQHMSQIEAKSGSKYFTTSMVDLGAHGAFIDQVFPATYFYPCSYQQRRLPKDKWMKPESYAIYHWEEVG